MRASLRQALLKLKLVLHEIVALSPRTMAAITVNSVRLSLARADRHASNHEIPLDIGTYTGASAVDDGRVLAATFQRGTLRVEALSDVLVRLAWGPGPEPCDVATRDAHFDACPVTVDVIDGRATLSTEALRVVVDDDGVSVYGSGGEVRYIERTPLVAQHRHVHRRVLRDGERLCGLGEQAFGLDLTGTQVRLWNRDPGGSWTTGQNPLYCAIPVSVGLHRDGPVWAFHENTYDATVSVGTVEHARHGVTVETVDGGLVTYVAVGELDELMTTATTLLGRPSMPPRWALGYHHCRWGWRTQDAVERVLDGFVSRSLPVSAVHLDIDHMDRFRVFTFDAERFGSVKAFASRARELGTRLVTIVDPAIRRDPGYSVYADGLAGGHFVTDAHGDVVYGTVWPGWAAFPDFTSERTRRWWTTQYEALTSQGIAGIWHDMNEPTSITLWGDRTLPRSARHDLDGRGGSHAEAHNLYGLYMNSAGYDALANDVTRPFVLSRSGWAGIARHAWHWTADVDGTTTGLRQQIPTFLGLGLSSVPFTGSDIGGFSGVPSPELYVRWLELGIVSPLCRTHCSIGSPDREPWCFEPAIEASIGRLLRARYRLLPHLYRLAEESHRLGYPMLRSTDWPTAGSPSGAKARVDVVLVGDELAFVPVAEPHATEVRVSLPAGTWWRHRLCGSASTADEALHGVSTITLDAPLGEPVLLQRGGTVVVLDDGWVDPSARLAADHATHRWALHVALDGDGHATGTGFEDSGDGDGAARYDTYEARADDDGVTLTWSSDGAYDRVGAVDVVVAGSAGLSRATCDGVDVAVEVVDGRVRVALPGRFERLELR